MNKPDFTQMTRKELKTYIRQHPTDDDAIRELFINRWDKSKAKRFPYPLEMTQEELDNVFQGIAQKDN